MWRGALPVVPMRGADIFARSATARRLALLAGLGGIRTHALKVCADMGCEIGLVDNKKIGSRDGRAALAGDIVALADRNHIKCEVGKVGREGSRQIIAA